MDETTPQKKVVKELRRIIWVEDPNGNISKYQLVTPKVKKEKKTKTPTEKSQPKKTPRKKTQSKTKPAAEIKPNNQMKKNPPKKTNNVGKYKTTEAEKLPVEKRGFKIVLKNLTKKQLDEMMSSHNRKPLKTSIEKNVQLNITQQFQQQTKATFASGTCVFRSNSF